MYSLKQPFSFVDKSRNLMNFSTLIPKSNTAPILCPFSHFRISQCFYFEIFFPKISYNIHWTVKKVWLKKWQIASKWCVTIGNWKGHIYVYYIMMNFILILQRIFKKFEKILQIAHLVPKMNSPWSEYEKWYITSCYIVKPYFCQILLDFLENSRFRIQKTGYLIQKFIGVKTYLGQSEYYL